MSDDLKKIEEELADIEAMFVQTGREITSDSNTITVQGVGHATLFFADRPQRVVGHMTTRQFVEAWGDGENSFADDPPNAVISFLDDDDEAPEDAIVVLKDPGLEGDKITYTVVVLEGKLPDKASSCSVFIDPFGRPLSPVSVAGVRRRQRRRGI
jgi:hypothetical protein